AGLIAELEPRIADAAAGDPPTEGTTAAPGWIDPADLSKIGFYTPRDTRAAFLTHLGFSTPPSVEEAAQSSDSFVRELSAEQADVLDGADVFVGYGTEKALRAAQADSLIGKIAAIERGSVALLEDDTPLAAAVSPSALSIPWMLPEYTRLLGEAAARVQ